jgi:hypothetical protein
MRCEKLGDGKLSEVGKPQMEKGRRRFRGSMTLEASVALPLFIFFFVNIMTVFNIVKVQCDFEAALHQTGSEMSRMAFDLRLAEMSDEGRATGVDALAGAAGVFYAKGKVREYLGDGLEKSCVTGGYDGVSYLWSRVLMGNDIIDLRADYYVHPMISLIGFKEFKVRSRYYGHAWTGYDIDMGLGAEYDEDEVVYVTEYGEVYHRNIDCSHLRLKVRSIGYDAVSHERNVGGGRYRPCELCGGGIAGGNVFVTDHGDKYHSTTSCSGLKRKIYTIRLSEVGGRPPCSSCGW